MININEILPNDFIFVEDKTIDRPYTLYQVRTFIQNASEYPEDYGKAYVAHRCYPTLTYEDFKGFVTGIIKPHLIRERTFINDAHCPGLPALLEDKELKAVFTSFREMLRKSNHFWVKGSDEVDWSSLLKEETKYNSCSAFRLMKEGKVVQRIGPLDQYYLLAEVKPLNGLQPFYKVFATRTPNSPQTWTALCWPGEFVKLMEYDTFRLVETIND